MLYILFSAFYVGGESLHVIVGLISSISIILVGQYFLDYGCEIGF